MKEAEREFFSVQMFGDFSIVCDGKKLILGRNSSMKYMQLLQLVWLQGEKGVTKERLVNVLYDRSDVSDYNNSINNLLYQLRKQMTKAGLPKGEYISHKGSVYVPDPAFPLKLDVHEFERLIEQAEGEADERMQCACYQKAFLLYRGDLLPSISTEIWVMSEMKRLKALFEQCVRWLGDYYKRQGDYVALEQLYEQAARLYPEDDWQISQIDMLMDKGEYKRAYHMYDEMVRHYSEEMGLPPTAEMVACYERMRIRVRQQPGEIEEIKRGIWECLQPQTSGHEHEAYYCSYMGFVDIFHMVSRNLDRVDCPVHLMLCTLVDYEGKMIQNPEKLNKRSAILRDIIGSSLRKGDVFTQYSHSQYLILLVGAEEDRCEIVYRRINSRLKAQAGTRAGMEYVVTSLRELPPPRIWRTDTKDGELRYDLHTCAGGIFFCASTKIVGFMMACMMADLIKS